MKLLRKHFDIITIGLMGDIVYLRDKKTNEATVTTTFETDLTKSEIFDQYQVNRPDLYVKQEPRRIIELDGEIHVMTMRGIEQTENRNDNYSEGNFTEESHTLVILDSLDLAKTDEMLIETLEKKLGAKRIEAR